MASTSTRPSTSAASGPSKPSTSAAGGGPGKTKQEKRQKTVLRMKSNALKRKNQDEELRILQEEVDGFIPPAKIDTFDQLPLSARTKKGLRSSHFINPTPIQALSLPASLQTRDVLGSARTGSGKTIAFLIPLLERLYREKWGPLDGLGAVVLSPTRELAIQTFEALRSIGAFHQFSAGLVIGGKNVKDEQDRLTRMNILIATPGRLLQHFDSTAGLDTNGVKVLVLDEADRLLDLGFAPTLKAIINHLSNDPERQTMLFSATQNQDLVSLAKLSLRDPYYINVNKPGEEGVMPANLEQFYAVVPLDRKLDALWGFIKSHLKMKGVVFVSSCKQVRFVFETFKKLHPGLPLMHLHGKQKQPTRLDIFQRFSASPNALLICTDIASRGLDFPAVDWVVQLDCPEDVDMYIHRVGRTARYQSEGKGLCILLPSEEEGMKKRWEEKGIEVKKIKIKETKMGQLSQQMQGFAFRDPEIKYIGQRAFISYLKSIYIQKDKSIFKLSELPIEEYAASLGLPGAPQIKFINDASNANKSQKNQNRAIMRLKAEKEKETPTDLVRAALEKEVLANKKTTTFDDESEEEESEEESSEEESEDEEEQEQEEKVEEEKKADDVEAEEAKEEEVEEDKADNIPAASEPTATTKASKKDAVRTKYDRMFERKNQSVLTSHYTAMISHDDGADGDDDFLKIEKRDHTLNDVGLESLGVDLTSSIDGRSTSSTPAIPSTIELSKRKLKMGESKKQMLKLKGTGHKVTFDDEGQAHEVYEMEDLDDFEGKGDAKSQQAAYVKEELERMKEADVVDRQVAREKRQEKKRKRKQAERDAMAEEMEEGGVAVLGGYTDDEEEGEGERYQEEVESSPEPEPETKRRRVVSAKPDEDDEEELALRLLRGE